MKEENDVYKVAPVESEATTEATGIELEAMSDKRDNGAGKVAIKDVLLDVNYDSLRSLSFKG